VKKRPNVLFILSDQHNAKVMGHLGHPDVKTPYLDGLAEEGVRFDNCVTQNPICTPSRVSFLSGQYPHNHGYYGLCGPNPEGLPNILEHYRRAGYRTGAVGKIHCPEYWIEDDSDYYREIVSWFSIGGCPEYEEYLSNKGVLAWISRESIVFMEQALQADRPFFLHTSYPRPHEIYSPSEPFWSMYEDERITFPPNFDYDMSLKAPHLREMAEYYKTGEWTHFEPHTFEAGALRKQHGYLGLVTQTDQAIGQILEWLRDKGLEDNTIVIYSTDHGDYACEHGIMEKAPGICSDAITRIPFIWRWPGRFKKGHAAKEIVETVDVATTLCSLCDLELLQTSDGKDLSQLLSGKSEEVHKLGVTEFAWSKSVFDGRYRFVYYPKELFAEAYPEGFGELYDLASDPWEMENLYFKEKYQGFLQKMRDDLLEWLILTSRAKTVLPAMRHRNSQTVFKYRNSTNRDGKFHPDRLRDILKRKGSGLFRSRNYL
jgi:arylsulfatase A-like enzyme